MEAFLFVTPNPHVPTTEILSEKIERFINDGVDTGIMAYVL